MSWNGLVLKGMAKENGLMQGTVQNARELMSDFCNKLEDPSWSTRLCNWMRKKELFEIEEEEYLTPLLSSKKRAILYGSSEQSSEISSGTSSTANLLIRGKSEDTYPFCKTFLRIVSAKEKSLSVDERILQKSIHGNLKYVRMPDITFVPDANQVCMELQCHSSTCKQAVGLALFGFEKLCISVKSTMQFIEEDEEQLVDNTNNLLNKINALQDLQEVPDKEGCEAILSLYSSMYHGGTPEMIKNGVQAASYTLNKLLELPAFSFVKETDAKIEKNAVKKSKATFYTKLLLGATLGTAAAGVTVCHATNHPEYAAALGKLTGVLGIGTLLSRLKLMEYNFTEQRLKAARIRKMREKCKHMQVAHKSFPRERVEFDLVESLLNFLKKWGWVRIEKNEGK